MDVYHANDFTFLFNACHVTDILRPCEVDLTLLRDVVRCYVSDIKKCYEEPRHRNGIFLGPFIHDLGKRTFPAQISG